MKRTIAAILLALILLVGVLPPVQSAYAESKTVYIVSKTLNAYKKPSASSTVLGVMSYGEKISCTAVSGSWARIRNSSGAVAYCKKSGLSTSNPNKYSITAYIASDNVKIYKKPLTSSKVMMTLGKGSAYTCVAVTKDKAWCRLKNGKYYGYVQTKYLSKSPVTSAVKVYVAANTLKVYKSASTSSKVLGTMSYGQSLSCLAVSGSWARVKNSSGAVGYCNYNALSSDNPCTLSQTVFINTDNVNIYKKPSTSSGVMMKLKRNACYTAVGFTDDGVWARLKNGKYYGYIQAKYLSQQKTEETPKASMVVYVTADTLKVYKSPSTSSKYLGAVPFGESLGFFEAKSGWAKVQNASGVIGYCLIGQLSDTDPCTLSKTMYINRSSAKIYAKPLTSSTVTATLKSGNAVTVVGYTLSGGWARIRDGAGFGYIPAEQLSETKPEQEEQTAYVSAATLSVYSGPSSSTKLMGVMIFGESVTFLSVDDGWARLRSASGETGYCVYGGISFTDPCGLNNSKYVQQDSVPLYAKPLTDSDAIRLCGINETVTERGVTSDGKWALVEDAKKNRGFMQAQFLDDEKSSGIMTIAAKTVYVKDNTLPVYKKNDTSSSVLGTMSFGESMTCTGNGGGWSRVKNAAGTIGYCKTAGLTDKNPNTLNKTAYAKSEGVKVYPKPLTSTKSIATLSLNAQTTVVAVSTDEKWARVKNGSAYGYVQSSDLSSSPVSDTEEKKAKSVTELAGTLLGKPYVYGASGPSKFDCSGLAYYVYKNAAGITLKRTAYQQGYDSRYTTIRSISDLKAGDLVFFNTDGTPEDGGDDDVCDHVGIFISGKTFIHASSAGGKVMTSSLDKSSYYYRNFSWGKRILK